MSPGLEVILLLLLLYLLVILLLLLLLLLLLHMPGNVSALLKGTPAQKTLAKRGVEFWPLQFLSKHTLQGLCWVNLKKKKKDWKSTPGKNAEQTLCLA